MRRTPSGSSWAKQCAVVAAWVGLALNLSLYVFNRIQAVEAATSELKYTVEQRLIRIEHKMDRLAVSVKGLCRGCERE